MKKLFLISSIAGKKLSILMILFAICGSTHAAEESYDNASCKKATGQSTSLMAAVAGGIGVPEGSLKYEGAFVGGPVGGCMALFSTPKGPYECSVVAWTTDKGKTFFIGPPSSGLMMGMTNLCRKAS